MVHLSVLFWALEVFFGVIGALRGWAKELLVSFSILVALMIINLLETYTPWVLQASPRSEYIIRALIIVIMAFFGYQTPGTIGNSGGGRREWLQNRLLGFGLGLLNGYLIVGSLWYYLHELNYFVGTEYADWAARFILPPDPATPYGAAALRLVENMPPRYLGVPLLYVVVTIAFAFVLIVFV